MSTRLKDIVGKKSEVLSKILKVDPKSLKVSKIHKLLRSNSSGPNTKVITNIQETIKNPLFNLSIADYELMCGNNMIIKMMSNVLECEEKQLKKFCKYINVYKENINSSPSSIKNKIKSKISLNKLPDDLLTKIVEKYKSLFKVKHILRDWIPLNKLNWKYLSENPNAIDLLKANKHKIVWDILSSNPTAIELLKANRNKINWDLLSKNPNPKAIEMLKANPEKINWDYLSSNPNPEAIELLKANRDEINWLALSSNPNPIAIELLRENLDLVNWDLLSSNPVAIELLIEEENQDNINTDLLSSNPNAIIILENNPDIIFWDFLSTNPNAIELLKANPTNIHWSYLSENRNAIDLIKERVKYEKGLNEGQYRMLRNKNKIDWNALSSNPAIFVETVV